MTLGIHDAITLARDLINAIPQACLLLTEHAPPLANTKFYSHSGYTPETLALRCPGSLIAPHDRQKLSDALKSIEEGVQPDPLVLETISADGAQTPVLFQLQHFENPILPGVLVTHTNLDQNSIIGREFLRHQAQLETIIRMLPLIALVIDENLTIVEILATRKGSAGLVDAGHNGKHLFEVFTETPGNELKKLIELTLIDQAEHSIEYQLELIGEAHWFEARARSLPPIANLPRSALVIILDTTARRKSSEQARTSETRYQAVVNALPDAIRRWLPDLTLTFANEAYCSLFGAHETIIGRGWTHFLPENDVSAIEQEYRALIKSPGRHTCEHSVIDTTGSRHTIAWTDIPIFDKAGQLVEFQSLGRDITGQRTMEKELASRESMLTSILAAIPNPVFYKNTEKKYLGCNPAFTQLFNLGDQAILGQTLSEIASPEIFQRLDQSDSAILGGQERDSFHLDANTPDGKLHHFLFNKAAFHDQDGQLAGIVGVVTDISDRIAHAQYQADDTAYLTILSALRAPGQTPNDYPELLDQICHHFSNLSGIWFNLYADKLLSTATCGPLFEDWNCLGLERNPSTGLLGQAMRLHGHVFCPNLDKLDKHCVLRETALAKGFRAALALPCFFDHQPIGCYLFLAPSEDDLREYRINHIGLLVDEMIRSLQEHSWRKQVAEQESHLQAQLLQAQKLESVGIMAGGVAHEINNPLTGMINYAQLIFDRLPDEYDSLRSFSAEIISEGDRISRIVRNLLVFSRQDNLPAKMHQVSEIIAQISLLCKKILEKSEVDLSIEIADDLPGITCRGEQIAQVLLNLIINARDALNDRYPDWVPAKRVLVTAGIHPQLANWLRISVQDWGKGIPDEIRSQIFDPFFSTKESDIGTGLGLSVSYGIVQAHGGKLGFTTSLGHGTTFSIDLPFVPPASLSESVSSEANETG
jgi:PAS domain S-box-containing protein